MEANKNTEYMDRETGKCESLEEFRERILPDLASQRETWKPEINRIIAEAGYGKNHGGFGKKIGFSRQSVSKWCNKGAVPDREGFIRIGLGAGMDADGINLMLQKYGRQTSLYSKDKNDCVCIYASRFGADALETYDRLQKRLDAAIPGSEAGTAAGGTAAGPVETVMLDEKLSGVDSEDEFERFINEHAPVFRLAYGRLHAKMKDLLLMQPVKSSNVDELAVQQNWSSSLSQTVYSALNREWVPTRNKIISFGLHMNLPRDGIDMLLGLARMGPLYARSILDGFIIYMTDYADLSGFCDPGSPEYTPDRLCNLMKGASEVLADVPELEDIFREFPEYVDDGTGRPVLS